MIQLYALIRDTLVIQRHEQAETEGMVEKDIPSKQQPKDSKERLLMLEKIVYKSKMVMRQRNIMHQ